MEASGFELKKSFKPVIQCISDHPLKIYLNFLKHYLQGVFVEKSTQKIISFRYRGKTPII
jgi:hypothetical protein